jgi:two-component system, OmpR family, sensor histidine kinase MprB
LDHRGDDVRASAFGPREKTTFIAPPGSPGELWAQELRHDLRQPLATVSLLVDTVMSRGDIPGDLMGTLSRIQEQTGWMSELLRSTEGEPAMVSVVDLADVVEGPCLAMPGGAPYDVSFVRVDEVGVLVDPVDLKRCAWNLMDNARRAVARGGRVETRVRRHRRDALLEVADSGPGFGRIARHQGHGLVGVRRFAQRFGGDFSVGTSSLGGALVTLRLPLAPGGARTCGH